MFPGLQLQSHKSPKLLCCRAAIKRAAHLGSSSSAVFSHEAVERPLSLVLFLSRLSRNRKRKMWRALLLSGRLTRTPALQRLRKRLAHRRRSRRRPTNRGTSSHRRYSENWWVHPIPRSFVRLRRWNHSWSLSTDEQMRVKKRSLVGLLLVTVYKDMTRYWDSRSTEALFLDLVLFYKSRPTFICNRTAISRQVCCSAGDRDLLVHWCSRCCATLATAAHNAH